MHSREGESSKIRVPESLKLHTNRTTNTFNGGIALGSQFSKKLRRFRGKMPPKRNPNRSLSRTWEELELLIFTLGSTWLPKWCPMAPKVAPRVPKGCQNGAKMEPKCCPRSPKCGPKGSNGGLSSKVYIYIYISATVLARLGVFEPMFVN